MCVGIHKLMIKMAAMNLCLAFEPVGKKYPYPLSVRGELTNLVQATPCGKVKLITVVGISCRRIGGNT